MASGTGPGGPSVPPPGTADEADIQYTREDLALAREIYTELIRTDLQAGTLTPDLLRMGRDPELALVNVVEAADALDPGQMQRKGKNGKKQDEEEDAQAVADLVEGAGMQMSENKDAVR